MTPSFKTRQQFALELGLSESTLRRRLRSLQLKTAGKLLSPVDQETIRRQLGFPSHFLNASYSPAQPQEERC